jgi:hypothetical protein
MTSAEFTRWAAWLAMDPPMEVRADYLATAIVAHINRVQGTLGGKPPRLGPRLIAWDRRDEDDQEGLAEWIGGTFKEPT